MYLEHRLSALQELTFFRDLLLGFNGLGKENCKMIDLIDLKKSNNYFKTAAMPSSASHRIVRLYCGSKSFTPIIMIHVYHTSTLNLSCNYLFICVCISFNMLHFLLWVSPTMSIEFSWYAFTLPWRQFMVSCWPYLILIYFESCSAPPWKNLCTCK